MAPDEDIQQKGTEKSPQPELLAALWPLFFIGKIFGLIHLRRTGYSEVTYDPITIYTIPSIVLLSTSLVFFCFGILVSVRRVEGHEGSKALVSQFGDLVYKTHVILNIIFCMYQSRKFPELFQYWAVMEKKLARLESLVDFECCKERKRKTPHINQNVLPLDPVGFKDGPGIIFLKNFKKHEDGHFKNYSKFVITCWIIIGFYATHILLGWTFYVVGEANRGQPNSAYEFLMTVSDIFILKELSTWWGGLYVLIVGHIMDICWGYGDMLIFLYSYTLRYNYKRLNKTLEIIKDCHPSVPELEHLRVLHWDLALGIRKADASLGFITTGSFILNTMYFFGRLYVGIAEDLFSPNIAIVFDAGYVFFELTFRIFGSCIIAARLNDETERTLSILMAFPDVNESEEHYLMMERFRNQVSSGKIALTGNGFFTLNRHYIISLLSGLATYEVIILQNSG